MSRAALFAAAKATRDELERQERAAAAALRGIAGRNSGRMGLTPDSVKASPEYRAAKAAHESAFARLQRHNAAMTREFRAELRAERRERVSL